MAGKIAATDWADIVTAYSRGEKSVLDLAAEYGVSHQAISEGLRSRGVTRNSAMTETINNEEDLARKEHEERIGQAKKQREKFAKYNDAIVQMTMKRLIDGDKHGDLRNKNAEILVLKNAATIIHRARKENWVILDIDRLMDGEESLPDLNVGEYTPEELESIRSANEEQYLEGVNEPSDYSFDEENGDND